MKHIIGRRTLALGLLALAGASLSQGADEYTERMIANLFRTGAYDGHMTKLLRALGDDGAVAIARVVSTNTLNKLDVETVLDLLHESFSDVSLIQQASNREPRVALVLLRYLECSTQDPDLKRKIEDAKKALPPVSASPPTAR